MNRQTLAEVARRFLLEHNQADYKSSLAALLTADCLVHEYLPGMPPGLDRAGYEAFIGGFRAALPDIHNVVDDLFVDGDRAAVRWTGTGTHTGEPLMGKPARGRKLAAHGIYLLRFSGERIAEVWSCWDNLSVLAQLD